MDRRLNPQHIMLTSGSDLLAGTQPGHKGGYGYADDMIIMALQAATHWNALSHMFHDYHVYNNRHCSLVSAEGAAKNSITVAAAPIVSRAVLLDFPRALSVPRLPEGHHITVEEIEHTLLQQRVSVESGDILLFRTGHMARFLSSGEWNEYTYTNAPGPCLEVLPWLHQHQGARAANRSDISSPPKLIDTHNRVAFFSTPPLQVGALAHAICPTLCRLRARCGSGRRRCRSGA
jgi:putative cyclase